MILTKGRLPRRLPLPTRMRSDLIYTSPVSSEVLLSKWFRNHLFILGFDKLKLELYQRFSSRIPHGGMVKSVVFDLSLFLKHEWAAHSELLEHVGSNVIPDTGLADFRRFYISLGYALITEPETSLDSIADKVVELYSRLRGDIITTQYSNEEKRILRYGNKYYRSVNINYKLLYDPRLHSRSITVRDFTITLPPLPQIKSKSLLAKALLHKELYRAVVSSNHVFSKTLQEKGILSVLAQTVVRHDLLFLDGLGDFFLATELSEFLYRFRLLEPYSADSSFGKKTYMLLRTIMATNTLLLRLAVAYNLHTALEDTIVQDMLTDSYIPILSGRLASTDEMDIRYEEEFVADYFEQYVGALYLEQPDVAKQWVNQLFELLLFLISDPYRVRTKKKKNRGVHYDYRAWGVDVIGRSV